MPQIEIPYPKDVFREVRLSASYQEIFDEFLRAAGNEIDDLHIMRRVIHRYPFDTVAHALWIKTLNTGKAVSLLLAAGLHMEAYGLSRGIVEIAYTLRFITHNRDTQVQRTMQFIKHSVKDRELWLALALKQPLSKDSLRNVERLAIMRELVPDEISAHRHWSGERQFPVAASKLDHPLDPHPHSKDDDALQRACDYYHPSVFLHASCAGSQELVDLDNAWFSSNSHATANTYLVRRATAVAFLYTQHVLLYALYGMNVAELAGSLSISNQFRLQVDSDGIPVIFRIA